MRTISILIWWALCGLFSWLVIALIICVLLASTAQAKLPDYYVGLTDSSGVTVPMTGNKVPVTGTITANPGGNDACLSKLSFKTSVVVNIAAAGTSEIVAAVAGQAVSVCGWVLTVAGTTPTLQFIRGTKVTTACDTGPANLSGTFAPTSGSTFVAGEAGATVIADSASNELCIVAVGAGVSIQGVLTFVQQ